MTTFPRRSWHQGPSRESTADLLLRGWGRARIASGTGSSGLLRVGRDDMAISHRSPGRPSHAPPLCCAIPLRCRDAGPPDRWQRLHRLLHRPGPPRAWPRRPPPRPQPGQGAHGARRRRGVEPRRGRARGRATCSTPSVVGPAADGLRRDDPRGGRHRHDRPRRGVAARAEHGRGPHGGGRGHRGRATTRSSTCRASRSSCRPGSRRSGPSRRWPTHAPSTGARSCSPSRSSAGSRPTARRSRSCTRAA